MKTALRNFFNALIRFKTATLLNLLGLAVAFASFILIGMQVYQELTFDTFYPTAGRLYQFEINGAPGRQNSPFISRPMAEEIFTASPGIKEGAYRTCYTTPFAFYDLSQGASSAVEEAWYHASDDYPEVFGLEAVAGNFADFKMNRKAIVSQSAARRVFGQNDPVGQSMVLSTPFGYDTMQVAAVYRDLPVNASQSNGIIQNIGDRQKNQRGNQNFSVFLLIDSPEEATQVASMLSEMAKERMRPEEVVADHQYTRVTKLSDRYFSPENADHKKGNLTTIYSLIGVAVLILLVAMVNFINFSMALVPRRIRNINTRKVLGSTVGALRWQQIGEAVGLAVIAWGLSLGIVYALSGTSFASLLDADMRLGANWPLLWLTLGLALVTGLLAALYPALYSTSFSPALVLKGSFGLSEKGRRLRTGLIGFQYVISLVLIVVAGSVWMQYQYMRRYDIGLTRDNVLSTKLSRPMSAQQEALTDKLRSLPEVVDVAYAWTPVLNPGMGWGRPYNDEIINFKSLPVTPNFASVMGIEIAEGRDFREEDKQKTGVLIFNQTAQKNFNLELGRQMDGAHSQGKAEIVGIAKDFNFRPLHYPVEAIALYIFGTEAWGPLTQTYIKVRGNDPVRAMKQVRETMLAFDPDAAGTFKIEFFDQSIGAMYEKENHQASLITLFSLLAVVISTIGAFGLILFETQYRRKEIGLRKVFGATVADVLNMFNRRYVRIVGVCFVLAAPLAYYIIRQWQGNFTYKSPVHAWVFGASLAIVLIITLTTVTLQSYRAATENPAEAIKAE